MTVWLADRVAEAMELEAASKGELESGGALLGWQDGDDRVVMGMIGPGPFALHGRHAFVPDHGWQVQRIREMFESTKGDLNYLGDWHSHPHGIAAMSDCDVATLRRIALKIPGALMAIIAGSARDWAVGCWQGRVRRTLIFRSMEVEIPEVKVFAPPPDWPVGIVHD